MAFPDGWTKYKSIPLNGSSDGEQTDYQTPVLTVTWETGMESDFGDIRFVDSDLSTELSYHLVSYVTNTSATFILKVPTIPTGGKTIYMYFGKSGETTTSDPSNVYKVYISGNTDESNKFTLVDIYNSGVNASLTYDSGNKYYKLKTTSVEDLIFAKIDDLDSTANLILKASIYRATAMSNQEGGLVGRKKASDTLILGRYITQSVNRLDITQGLSGSYSVIDSDSYTLPQLTWFTVELIIVGTTATLNWYNSSGTLINSQTGTISGSIDSGDWGLLGGYSVDSETYFKNIIASKTTANLPTWGSWGSTMDLIVNINANDSATASETPYIASVTVITPSTDSCSGNDSVDLTYIISPNDSAIASEVPSIPWKGVQLTENPVTSELSSISNSFLLSDSGIASENVLFLKNISDGGVGNESVNCDIYCSVNDIGTSEEIASYIRQLNLLERRRMLESVLKIDNDFTLTDSISHAEELDIANVRYVGDEANSDVEIYIDVTAVYHVVELTDVGSSTEKVNLIVRLSERDEREEFLTSLKGIHPEEE